MVDQAAPDAGHFPIAKAVAVAWLTTTLATALIAALWIVGALLAFEYLIGGNVGGTGPNAERLGTILLQDIPVALLYATTFSALFTAILLAIPALVLGPRIKSDAARKVYTGASVIAALIGFIWLLYSLPWGNDKFGPLIEVLTVAIIIVPVVGPRMFHQAVVRRADAARR